MTDALDVRTPFGEPVEEIPLPHAPLIAVVAQIRFPPIASIAREEFVGPFQERIRQQFPVLRQEREVNVVLTPSGVSPGGDPAPIWRFLDRPKDPEWKVSLAPSFVALDTSNYESRTDFLRRFRAVLIALTDTIAPSTSDRIGIRYVDRVQLDEGNADLEEWIRPEVLGMVPIQPGGSASLSHSISDTEFQLGDATLHGRWGLIPPSTQLDPLHGDAIDVPSWILDLDMYTSKMGEFNVAQLMSATEEFAARIYRFFRWAVRPGLLRRYGGSV